MCQELCVLSLEVEGCRQEETRRQKVKLKGDRGRQKETMFSFLLPEIVPHLTFDSSQYLTVSFIVFLSPAQSKQKLDLQVWDVFALFPIFLLGKRRLLTPRAPKTV